ncbi:MAG TPA: PVC-type heme-binding CxxCH protein [Pirellulales bacterium]|nr:PVC-type heme-binding CxxCH protein [Pirellulales bacterium]
MTRPWFALILALAAPSSIITPRCFAQLSPEAELADLQAAPEFDVAVFAAEPMITNPTAIDVDTHGRVWVAETQLYRKAAPEQPAEKIKVLEDTDGDGRADRVTVFADGVNQPMSICVAGAKVYVATSPDLWVYEDNDGDLRADGPPTKLLTGLGKPNHDHGAHSLVLGPDHKWWMAHGDTGFDVTGTDGSHAAFRWGGMLRGELDGSQVEAVAVNFRNPYEVCISSFGEPICTDNDNDGNFSVRVCWIMEGGDYGWFGGPPGPRGSVPESIPFSEHWHFRGHIPGFVPATLVTGFGSPCGICYYEGDAFGPKYKNMPLHADAGPREVRRYPHEKVGYGMRATSEVFLTSKDDKYFRPDDVCVAPDGSLLVSDWYDGGVGGHAYNNPEQGRIFRLTPKGKKLKRVGKPGPYTVLCDALEGLKNPNLATQFLAREYFLKRPAAELLPLLVSDEPNYRARALWVLDRIGGDARQKVVEQLKSPDASMRALAVRILRRHGQPYADMILPMADDADPEVKRELLLALPKLEGPQAMDALVKLARQYDGRDRYQLEAIHIAAKGRDAPLYEALKEDPGVTLHNVALLQLLNPSATAGWLRSNLSIAATADERRRLVTQLALSSDPQSGRALIDIAADGNTNDDIRCQAIELFGANLRGPWQELLNEQTVQSQLKQLLHDPAMQVAALDMVETQSVRDLGEEVLALADDLSTSQEVRQRALAVLATVRPKSAANVALKMLKSGDTSQRAAALGALVELQDWSALKPVLLAADGDSKEQQKLLDATLATTGGALAALKWIDAKELSEALTKRAIAAGVNHPDANVRIAYERFVPEGQRPQRLGAAFKPADILALAGDPRRGEQIFFQSTAAQCKNCHQVRGVGGTLGPDLSAIGKKYERATLLETILEPSKAISHEYIPYVVQTSEGQIYAGFLVEDSEKQIVLKDAQSKLHRIKRADIEAIEKQAKSLMPELVLRDVTAQDAADLLAFMTSLVGNR